MFRIVCVILISQSLTSQAADVAVRPALSFSKSFGGTGTDSGGSVATDASGDVYVAGTTDSVDFPIAQAFQPTIGGAPLRMTADGGKVWTSPGVPHPVYSVAGSPEAPATLYAGTTSGIFKSVDSGKTWTALAGTGSAVVNAVLVDSVDPTTVYAATATGLLKSVNGGATWRSMGTAGNGLALAANPAQSGTLLAAFDVTPVRPNLYRTSDGGASWTALSNSPPGSIALAFDAATPNLLYAIASTTGLSSGGATSVYKSLDNGDSWTKLTAPSPRISTFALAAGGGKVYVGTANGLQLSGDGGLSWKSAAGVTGATGNIAVDPAHPQSVYADGDGMFASADGGTTWSRISSLRQVVETIAVLPTVPAVVAVGAAPGRNVFVTKWSGDGKQMFYSTYLGGSYYDSAAGIGVDSQGNAYVVGQTASTDFPVTAGAIQPASHGTVNAFLAKISPDGKSLLYSTYLGGSGADGAFTVAIDDTGNAYVAGAASSSDFPVTAGAFQTHKQKSCSVNSATVQAIQSAGFVSKIAADGSGLRYSTFLGGSCPDLAAAIAIDGSGSAYVVGVTGSADFPVTQGSVQPKWGGGSASGFLAKLTPQGNALVYSTFLGGKGQDVADGVAVDAKGAAYVAGGSWGLDQPTYAPAPSFSASPSGIYPNADGVGFGVTLGGAAYVMKVDAAGSARLSLKYLGGTSGYARTLALDPAGNVWVAGYFSVSNSSARFPMLHPFQAGTGSAFITELAPDGQTLLFSSAMESVNRVAADSAGNTFVTGWSLSGTTPAGSPKTGNSVLLMRIDGAVASAVTVEDPRRLVPGWNSPLDYGIAGGEFLVLTGSGLGPVAQVDAQIGQDGKLLTSLGGTTVTFGGVPAPLISVQAEKIVCIAPFSVTSKGAILQVQSGGSLSNSIKLPAATTAIEPLAAVNQDGTVNSSGYPAPPGSIVTVYVAGFGQTTPASADGFVNDNSARQMSVASLLGVQIAGQNAQILYAGPAPGEVAGVSQINFRVPQLSAGTHTAYIGWGPSTATRPFLGDYNSIALTVGQP